MRFLSLMIGCFVFLLSLGCVNFSDKTPDIEKELRVMVWNTWHKDIRPVEEKSMIEIIKASDLDVVLMIETYGVAKRLAKETGMNFAIFSRDPEAPDENLCIFFKEEYELLKKEHHPYSTFHFISCVIDVAGTPVRLADIWIDYLPDTTLVPTEKSEAEIRAWEREEGDRISQVSSILRLLKGAIADSDEIPLIVGGDFNSHSHLDWTEATANLVPYGHGGKTVQWEVSSRMEEAGFIDSFREIHPDPATNYGVTWLSDSQPCRIDYLYYQGKKIRAIESQSYNHPVQTEGFEYNGKEYLFPSDHGFVFTTFKINGK